MKEALGVVDRKVKSVDEIESMAAGSLIERVELKRDGMQITLNLRALLPADFMSAGGASLRITRAIPIQMRRRGVETRLVIPGEAVAVSRSDPALLRALSRGYQWFGELSPEEWHQPSRSRPEKVSAIAMCATWSHWDYSLPKSWKRSVRGNNPLPFRRSA